jgi:hypothetical protein
MLRLFYLILRRMDEIERSGLVIMWHWEQNRAVANLQALDSPITCLPTHSPPLYFLSIIRIVLVISLQSRRLLSNPRLLGVNTASKGGRVDFGGKLKPTARIYFTLHYQYSHTSS